MSMGYGGIAKKVSEDKTHVLYAYGDFNLNIPGLENKDHRCDGILLIAKKMFYRSGNPPKNQAYALRKEETGYKGHHKICRC